MRACVIALTFTQLCHLSHEGFISGKEEMQEKKEEKKDEEKDELVSDEEDDASDKDVDDSEMPESPVDIRENIKSKFLVEMPEDFYDFWKLCQKLNAEDPLGKFVCVCVCVCVCVWYFECVQRLIYVACISKKNKKRGGHSLSKLS